MRLFIVTFLIFISSQLTALAVDLVNRDNGGYELQITTSDGSISTSINPLVIKNNICSSECEIKVKGVGVIKANHSETVYIENGRLSKK
jgi:hypothetical protein